MTRIKHLLILCVLSFFVGCASTHKPIVHSVSSALEKPELTTANQLIQADLKQHPGQSGFMLLDTGEKAFTSRMAMTQAAEKTLDVQYYIWNSDITGSLLIEQLIKAAQRGVRVRLLIDDVDSWGRDFGIAKLNAMDNFEVRIFNPFENRSFRVFEFITDMSRLNHRMHNKAFIMDNTFAITGGRNVGDRYFGVSSAINFRDLDILSAGPIVQDISKSFDVFWNSEWAIPISSVSEQQASVQDVQQGVQALQDYIASAEDFPYPIDRSREEIYQRIQSNKDQLIWAEAKILYDNPAKKIDTETGYQGITPYLRELVNEIQTEILIESAYFIPGVRGTDKVLELHNKGIKVRILTNSMISNDVAAAFVFYEKYRQQMLENGAELYEFRPDPNAQKKFWSLLASKSAASLHTKVMVFDRRKTFIGSLNLDPRSIDINTEVGLLIDSTELAEQIIAYMDIGIQASDSYRLEIEKVGSKHAGELVWVSSDNGKEIREYSDPKAGFWRPISAWFISLLPLEEHI
ncbi:MAG: hypothetical protein GQ582_03215 [Methyloprofundus sp.]|nr:hypothetical protein [Methyloprofundus sp.]